LIIRRLIVPITMAVVAIHAGRGFAQSAFPAPLPGQAAAPANDPAFPPLRGQVGAANDPAFPPVRGQAAVASDPAFPPVNGAPAASFPVTGAAPLSGGLARPPAAPSQAGPADDCMKGFLPLREDAEKRGKAIKAASDRHAPPDEACKLIGGFGQAEIKMIKYVEANAARCGIPAQIPEQLKAGHKNTEGMQKRVCDAAQQGGGRGPAGPSLSEVLGSAATVPEATTTKKGGSTFDTLNGNVLTR
jgi:hypothetical protein